MTYNPSKHHRHSIRLKGYDYSQAGLYFITVCCQDRICRFGEIVEPNNYDGHKMILNEYGQIAYCEWEKLSERFPNVELDVFQIMPNHIHGIIALNEISVGAGFTPAQSENITPAQSENITPAQNDMDIRATARVGATARVRATARVGATARVAPTTVSDIVGAYKSLVANGCLAIFKTKNETMGKLWQRNYHEHIIRDEQSYLKISDYIVNNPANWNNDSLK